MLVRNAGLADVETGGEYTVRLYREEADGEAKRVVLQPLNPEFPPLTITQAEGNEVQIIAEVVLVLPVHHKGPTKNLSAS